MKHYLKLVRVGNLTMVAFMYLLVRFGFFNQIHFKDANGVLQVLEINQALDDVSYYLLILATLLIMAGGYVINNIYDVDTDNINKPNDVVVGTYISEKTAYNVYFGLTISGVLLGFYLSRVIHIHALASVFVIAAALLYMYSHALKQIPILGNVIVALLAALSILNIGFFNILPAIGNDNYSFMHSLVDILKSYAIFAFLLHFARELIKTIEDYEGDKAFNLTTAATSFGKEITKYIAIAILVGFVGYMIYYIIQNLIYFTYVITYFILFIITPTLFAIIKTFLATEKNQFALISKLLKYIMIPLILSLMVIVVLTKIEA